MKIETKICREKKWWIEHDINLNVLYGKTTTLWPPNVKFGYNLETKITRLEGEFGKALEIDEKSDFP